MSDGVDLDPQWVIHPGHPDYPGNVIDLSEFATGVDECTNPGWKGSFTGRPLLLMDIWEALQVALRGLSPNRLNFFKSALRSFWRYLDSRERYLSGEGIANIRVERLHQITGVIFDGFMQPGPAGAWEKASRSYGISLRAIIEAAIDARELQPLHANPIPRNRHTPRDTATDEEGIAVIRSLRAATMEIFRRWQAADQMAEQGRDLALDVSRRGSRAERSIAPATEADAHTTYRAFISRTGIVAPFAGDLWRSLGYTRSSTKHSWWPNGPDGPIPWERVAAGLYPTSADVSIIALLCIARLAWNPSTVLGIDIDDWCAPYDDRRVWIYSQKARSAGRYQHGVCEAKNPSGPYSVLRRLIERTQPLRAWIKDNQDDHPTPRIALRSPFIGLNLRKGHPIFVADPEGDDTIRNCLRSLIANHNTKPGAIQVRALTPSDFRDIAAAVMFRDSRYSMWVKQALLGHASQRSTVLYGFRHASRRESHGKVVSVVQDVIDQVRDTGEIDFALTRARVEQMPVTSESMERLELYRAQRTYAGAVCGSPTDPPKEIDPSNPRDGRTRCAQGHLCVARSCPQATVLPESLDAICRSVAEMEWRESSLGMVRWASSSAQQDLGNLIEVLKEWPDEEVNARLGAWREKIADGRHKPLLFGGSHAEG